MGLESRVHLALKLRFPSLVTDKGNETNSLNVFINGEPTEVFFKYITEEVFIKAVYLLRRAFKDDLVEVFPESEFQKIPKGKKFESPMPLIPLGIAKHKSMNEMYSTYFKSRR